MCLLMIKTVNVVDRINVLADLKTAKPLELPPSLKSGKFEINSVIPLPGRKILYPQSG
ncbi:hypothetical protein AAG906_035035 [Vitis piasezkii]